MDKMAYLDDLESCEVVYDHLWNKANVNVVEYPLIQGAFDLLVEQRSGS